MAAIEGPVRNVKSQQEGADFVLRFVVAREGAQHVPVEMRGNLMYGVLNDGDRVQFDSQIDEYGIARPQYVTNLDNGSTIQLRRPAFSIRARRLGATIAVPLMSSALSGLLVFALTFPFTRGTGPAPVPPSSTSQIPTSTSLPAETTTTLIRPSPRLEEPFPIVSILLTIVTSVTVFILVRNRQLRRQPEPPPIS
jgi:hypothetical protein